MARYSFDWSDLDEVILGCANQVGEDNRNVARMLALLAATDKVLSRLSMTQTSV
jgi:3-oxo-5,6-didehydrosuberyl-CoA/3-oxoadipyl-CoA thiolase